MYKLLLAWRYLRTRFIALASIVSVTLGVATMIVVNSVMAGFVTEMKSRLHGILSDIEVKGIGLDGIPYSEYYSTELERLVGDDLEAATSIVHVPALVSFSYHGTQFSQPIALVGIDDETFGKVCEFNQFLANSHNREKLSFELLENGYDEDLGPAGWSYRREKAENQLAVQRLLAQSEQYHRQTHSTAANEAKPGVIGDGQVQFNPIPDAVPDLDQLAEGHSVLPGSEAEFEIQAFDRDSIHRRNIAPEEMFNPIRDQRIGLIMGRAISCRQISDPTDESKVSEAFLVRAGDDVQVNLFTAGNKPSPISENFTVVDFYSSNMHEYDSNFCFVPLSKLQKLRGMIDPLTGQTSVSAIQMRLKPGSDLNEVRDRLRASFPMEFPVLTWQDTQRPLLSAVNMEITILNILLFLIIAVAGFGILATFFMIVVEKTKDIGILKALGAPSRGVMAIFLAYGLSLGAVGTGVGILLGLIFVWNINEIAKLIERLSGQEVFDPTIYFFSEIPTIINPLTVLGIGFGAILIAVLASVLPALRAARMHPVEALRYE